MKRQPNMVTIIYYLDLILFKYPAKAVEKYQVVNREKLSMAMRRVGFSFMLVTLFFACATTNDEKDKEECTQQLVGLATCLQYVGGNAKSPTPDCCNGLKQLLKTNRKCLCVIVKDRNDPDLGLDINVTLALGLPSVCHAPANVSQCPGTFLLGVQFF